MSFLKFDLSTKLVLFVVLLLVLLVLGPLLVIASLNVLFGLALEFNLTTWGAVVIMHTFFHSAIKTK